MKNIFLTAILSIISSMTIFISCSNNDAPHASDNKTSPKSVSTEQRDKVEKAATDDALQLINADNNTNAKEQAAIQLQANASRLRRAGYPELADIYLNKARNIIQADSTNSSTDII